MSRTNKIAVIIGIVVTFFALIVIFWPQKEVVVEKKIIKTIPASKVLIPTQDKTPIESDTGAMITVLPDDEYVQMRLIYSLRNECPLDNDFFSIIYNYGSDKFEVTIPTENMPTFLQWKKDTGYNGIGDKYWVIKNND